MSMQNISTQDSGMSLSSEDSSKGVHIQSIKATVQSALAETIESLKNAGLHKEQLAREETERIAASRQQVSRTRTRHQGLVRDSQRLRSDVHRVRTEQWRALNNGAGNILKLKSQLATVEAQISVATAREAAMKSFSKADLETSNLDNDNIRSVLHALESVCEQAVRNANSSGSAAWTALRSPRDSTSSTNGLHIGTSRSTTTVSPSLGAASLVLAELMETDSSYDSDDAVPSTHDTAASENLDVLATANEAVAKHVGGLEKEFGALQRIGDVVVDGAVLRDLNSLRSTLSDKQRMLTDVERRMLAAEDENRTAIHDALHKLIKNVHAATQADKDKIRELDHALQLLQREKERHDKRAQQDQHDNQNTASALQDKLTRAVARGDELQRKLDAAEQRDNEHVRQAALERGKLEQSNSDLQRLQQECHDLRQRAEQAEQAARQAQMQCDVLGEERRMGDVRCKEAERERDMHMLTGDRLKDDVARLEDELAKCTADMRLSEAEAGRHRSDNQRNELTANELRAALSALEAQRLDEQRKTFDLQADLDSARRKISELEEELRRQMGLVEDFKQRAQKHADINRNLMATRDTADDQRIDAERKLRMQVQELDDAKVKAAFLESKVLELRRDLEAAQRNTDAADRAGRQQVDAAHVAVSREMDDAVKEVLTSKQQLELRIAELERAAATTAGAHAADVALLREQLALAQEQVREVQEHQNQLQDEVHSAVARYVAAETDLSAQDVHIAQLERELDAARAEVQRCEEQLMEAEARATEENDAALLAARRRIEELELLVTTMKPVGAPTVMPRGTHHSSADNDDHGPHSGTDKPLAVAAMEADLAAVRAELKAADARARRAELELQHARERGNGDIDVLRRHAQFEAEKLIETNNRLHEKLMAKRQAGQTDLLVRLAFLEAENKELLDVVTSLRNSDVGAHSADTIRIVNPRVISPQRQRSPGKKRFLRFPVAVWDSPPARALGIAKQDGFIAVANDEIIFADKNNKHVLRCPCHHIKRHGCNRDVLSIEIGAVGNPLARGQYYFATQNANEIYSVIQKANLGLGRRPTYASPP